MKINYSVNENDVIIALRSYPFDESEPYIEANSVDDVTLGVDKVINGKLIKDLRKVADMRQSNLLRARIFELKRSLADTDYLAIKFAEGELTADEFAATKAQRQA